MRVAGAGCRGRALSCAVLLAAAAARGAGGDSALDGFRTFFRPAERTVVLSYDVVYRLLGLTLVRIAEASIETTAGVWSHPAKGVTAEVYLVEARLDTREEPARRDSARVSFHDRALVVLTRDGGQSLLYVRVADQRLNPLLGRARVNRHLEVYDFQSGRPEFFHQDGVSGAATSELARADGIARQGREVAQLLRMASDICRGARPHAGFADSPRIFVDVDRRVVPFSARSSFERVEGVFPGVSQRTLRIDIAAAPEAPRGTSGRLSAWIRPLGDFARDVRNPAYTRVAAGAPGWSLVPLVISYDLALGCIQARLKGLALSDPPP